MNLMTCRQRQGIIAEIVMLCARVYAALEDVSLGQVADNLRSARISSLADGFLAELRASADIVYH